MDTSKLQKPPNPSNPAQLVKMDFHENGFCESGLSPIKNLVVKIVKVGFHPLKKWW